MTVHPPTPPSYVPARNLMLYVTEDCNLRCQYCFVTKSPKRMTVETARHAVDFFFQPSITGGEYDNSITFFGGEPFLELELLEEVVRYAREPRPNTYKHVRFCATTNGTIANARAERLIRDSGMSLLISMDGGYEASSFRPYLSGRSSYPAVARNLSRFTAWSHVMVRMTYHPQALDLVGNARHAFELGAPAIALCPVQEASWQSCENRLQEAYEQLADWYVGEARKGKILPLSVTNTLIRHHHHFRITDERPLRPCGVATTMLGVNTEGKVMPCHRFVHRRGDWLGSIEQAALGEKRQVYTQLTSAAMLGCHGCMARGICGGGCRAVALNAGLALNQPHPTHCLTMRAHARAVFQIYDTLTAEGNGSFRAMLRSAPVVGPLTEFALR